MKSLIRYSLVLFLVGLAGCATLSHYKIDGTRLHMYLQKPDAREVYFASSIDAFVLHPTRMNDNGNWEVVIPLGYEFRYFFVVDGTVILPPCRYKERDDFGSENCIFIPEL
jgi:hypothetical protein